MVDLHSWKRDPYCWHTDVDLQAEFDCIAHGIARLAKRPRVECRWPADQSKSDGRETFFLIRLVWYRILIAGNGSIEFGFAEIELKAA